VAARTDWAFAALESVQLREPLSVAIEPVSGTAKRKLKIGNQRLAPQSRQSRGNFSEIAEQRLAYKSLTRGNVGATHTAGYRTAETLVSVADDAVPIEPVSIINFPANREINREVADICPFSNLRSNPSRNIRHLPPNSHAQRTANFWTAFRETIRQDREFYHLNSEISR
jgi:hypothetical protein